jgi:sn-glycerol 3-phosphate transport system substrate-binding protein
MKSGYLPIRHAAMEVPEFKSYLDTNPNFKVFVEQMDFGVAEKMDIEALEITRNFGEAIERSTVGKIEVKRALDEAAEKSNRLLKEAKR